MDRGKDDAFNQKLKNQTLIEVSKDITSNEKLGVCQEYDRTKYDNVYKRKKFIEEHFGEKTAKDYIKHRNIIPPKCLYMLKTER